MPGLRRRPQARRIRFRAKELCPPPAQRPQGHEPDTLFVNITPAKPIKHFTAYDPVAKWTIGRVAGQASATRAKSLLAKSLLAKLLAEAPFPIGGIQVDGGSEFNSVFETECQARGLELLVLPPKWPGLNGGGERAQSTWR